MMTIDRMDPRTLVREGADRLRKRWPDPLRACIVAGSGFTGLDAIGTVVDRCSVDEVPGLLRPRVTGHGQELFVLETPAGCVLVFAGRVHYYEGHSPSQCATQVALARELGINNIILTNACGGLHPGLTVGSVVVVTDLLQLTFAGIHVPDTRADQHTIIDQQWASTLTDRCWEHGSHVRNGTYLQVTGPSYETRAEVRFMRRIGADVVGMSTAIEASWAARTGAHVSVVSLVTNTLTDAAQRLVTHDEVVRAAAMARPLLLNVLTEAIATSPIFAE